MRKISRTALAVCAFLFIFSFSLTPEAFALAMAPGALLTHSEVLSDMYADNDVFLAEELPEISLPAEFKRQGLPRIEKIDWNVLVERFEIEKKFSQAL